MQGEVGWLGAGDKRLVWWGDGGGEDGGGAGGRGWGVGSGGGQGVGAWGVTGAAGRWRGTGKAGDGGGGQALCMSQTSSLGLLAARQLPDRAPSVNLYKCRRIGERGRRGMPKRARRERALPRAASLRRRRLEAGDVGGGREASE